MGKSTPPLGRGEINTGCQRTFVVQIRIYSVAVITRIIINIIAIEPVHTNTLLYEASILSGLLPWLLLYCLTFLTLPILSSLSK